MKNKLLKVLIGDPGKTNDPFGVVGLEATWPEKKIYIRFAKQYKNVPYEKIAKKFVQINGKVLPHLILLERNFDFDDVYAAFQDTQLDIKWITTSANLTEKTRSKGWSVDKPFMIGWLRDEYKKHTIQWPEIQSDDMKELVNQRNQIVGITSPSGHVSYAAQRHRHDDMFMAKLIGCNAVRIWWDQQDAKN